MPAIEDLINNVVGENLDRLVTLDLRGQGIIKSLYDVARKHSPIPLTIDAARRLQERLINDRTVLLCTGFPGPHWESIPNDVDPATYVFSSTLSVHQIRPETDGLVATAAFARALDLGYRVKPVVVTEAEVMPMMSAVLQVVGLHVFTNWDAARDVPHSALLLDFPKEEAEAEDRATELVTTFDPLAAISIERPGRNSVGEYHMANGRSITPFVAKIDHLYLAAQARGALTIGIGDLGNELGLGILGDACRQYTECGARCRCACGQGIACTVASDITVVGAISDNVAHGVIAALAHLRGMPDLLPDGRLEERLLEVVSSIGAEDGCTGLLAPWVDGVRTAYHVRLIEQMHDVITYPRLFLELQRRSFEWLATHSAEHDEFETQEPGA